MSLLKCNIVIFLVFLLTVTRCHGYQYIVGVIEYNPFTNTSAVENIIEYNIAAYKTEIELLKQRNAEIVVFPEYGLTGKTLNTSYAQHVPKLSLEKIDYKDNIERLSNMAKEHSIALAVNLMEFETINDKTYFFNTEVIFDKNGQIIAKHRKINLNDEEKKVLTPGSNATVVEINGNRFRVLINEDLFSPLANFLNGTNNLAGYIVSMSWKNQFPFEIATSIQAGFAISNEIPVIAANLNAPSVGISGSGVYHYENSLTKSCSITGKSGISRNILDVQGKLTKPISFPSLRGTPNSDPLENLNIESYTFKKDDKYHDIDVTTTVDSKNTRCNLDMAESNDLEQIKQNYRIYLIRSKIQIGQEKFNSEICALLKYNTTTKKVERSTSNVMFKYVKLSFDDVQPSYKTFPLTLDSNLMPLNVIYRHGNNLTEIEGTDLQNVVLYGIQRLTKSSAIAVQISLVSIVFSVFVALYHF